MNVALVARQVGTASAFAPVAQALAARGQLYALLLYPLAHDFASREFPDLAEQVPLAVIDDECVIAELDRQPHLSVLVTGTSENASGDRELWRWARTRGLPTVAYLDQGVNIERRFASSLASDWPDAVVVIDEADAALMREVAPVQTAVRITGSPAVEAFVAEVCRQRANGRHTDHGRILFVTEPVTGMNEDEYRRANGFSDRDAFLVAARSLAALAGESPYSLRIIVRLHPRDSAERWADCVHEGRALGLAVEFDTCIRRSESVAGAALVTGTRSMLLFEAAAAAVPVISLQPGRSTACPLTDGRAGITVVEREGEAKATFSAALSGRGRAAHTGVPGDPCKRFIDLIAHLAGGREGR